LVASDAALLEQIFFGIWSAIGPLGLTMAIIGFLLFFVLAFAVKLTYEKSVSIVGLFAMMVLIFMGVGTGWMIGIGIIITGILIAGTVKGKILSVP